MSGVEEAKTALVGYAEAHDARRAASRRPLKTVAIAAGLGLLAARIVFGGSRRRRAAGVGGPRIMGALLLLRLAVRHGPTILRAMRGAKAAWDSPAGQRLRVEVLPRRAGGARRALAYQPVSDSSHPI